MQHFDHVFLRAKARASLSCSGTSRQLALPKGGSMQTLLTKHSAVPLYLPLKPDFCDMRSPLQKPNSCFPTASHSDTHSHTSTSTASSVDRPARLRPPGAIAERLAESPAAAMPNQRTTVPVDLGERSYPIHIGGNLLLEGRYLADMVAGSSALIVTNTTVAPLYLQR